MRRRSRAFVVVQCAALLAAALGLSAMPARATGGKHPVLFQNSLEKRSKAVRPSSGPGNSWSFVDHKLLGRVLPTADEGGTDYKPDFEGNELGTPELGNVTIAVDVTLSSKKSSAAGPSCGDARGRTQYVLEISNEGRYSLTLEEWDGGDTPFGSTPVASGSVERRATNHLVLKCTQSPRVDGGVQTVSGTVNGKKVGTQRVSERGYAYLANPQVGLHVGVVGPLPAVPTTASFSDLKVTQIRPPAKTLLDWSDPSVGPIDYLFHKFYPSCSGIPVTTSTPYEGDTHPLVISAYGLTYDNTLGFSDDPPAWAQPPFAEDFQLVACVEKTQDTVGPSCGTYTRADGVTGELRRTSYNLSARIVVAADGREIGQATLTGSFPDCPSQTTVAGNPPWTMEGGIGIDQVVQYVTGFTSGPPR